MVEYFVPTVPFASLPVLALGPDHRHAGELPPPARSRGRGHARVPRGRARHLQAVLASATSSPSSATASCGSRSRRSTPIVPVAVIGAEEQAPGGQPQVARAAARHAGVPGRAVPAVRAARAAAGEVPALLRRADDVHRRSRRRRRGPRRARCVAVRAPHPVDDPPRPARARSMSSGERWRPTAARPLRKVVITGISGRLGRDRRAPRSTTSSTAQIVGLDRRPFAGPPQGHRASPGRPAQQEGARHLPRRRRRRARSTSA